MKDPQQTTRFPAVRTSILPPADDPMADTRETEKAFSVPAPAERDRACLTLMSGPNAGQFFPLDRDECVIGRELDAHVHLADTSLSRRHARILRLGAERYVLEDLGSTNGTFVGGARVPRHELATGDRFQLGPKLAFRFAIIDEAEEMLQRQLFESSTRDPLTRAYNRKYLAERLAAEVAHARRHGTRLAVLLFDLDDFKRINDENGHPVGDLVLRLLADKVQTLIRVEDVFARFGGEEFLILIRASGQDDAVKLAERLRASVEQLAIPANEKVLRLTVSVGVASLLEIGPEEGGAELVARADTRLYRAKQGGRNRVCADDTT